MNKNSDWTIERKEDEKYGKTVKYMKYKKKKKGNIWDWIYRTREEKIVKEIIFEEIISKTW